MQQHLGQRIVLGQLLQYVFVRRGRSLGRLLDGLVAQPIEQNLTELLGRSQVEGTSRQFVSLGLELGDGGGQTLTLRSQKSSINLNTPILHLNQNPQGGHLNLGVDPMKLVIGLNQRPEHLVQMESEIRILA